jgi:alpha-galactosidase
MSIKISVIGAGSSVFSLSFIKDLCLSDHLKDCRVSFMDIDAERLDAAYELCVRYAKEIGSNLEISKTDNRIESLTGADYVVNTALHVEYEMWRRGWDIAEKLGYRFGGSLHIMHDEAFWINFYQFRLMESVYQDMQIHCPNAWYLLVANPVLAGITYLKRKYPNGKIVGLCHGFGGVYNVASTIGLDTSKIEYEMSGVNHLLWLTKLTSEGKDALPLLDAWVQEKSREHFPTCTYSSGMGPKAVDLYRRFGVFPIGDTGSPGGGAWGYWYHDSKETQDKWNDDPRRWFNEIYFDANERIIAKMRKAAYDKERKVTEALPPSEIPSEPMIPLIESLSFDIPRILIVNILNDYSYVPGIPTDFEVEIPALVNKDSIQGLHCRELPKPIIALTLRDRVAPVELELDAYINGDYEMLLSLILTDPWTKSEAQARQLLEAILSEPELIEMKQHYKKKTPTI